MSEILRKQVEVLEAQYQMLGVMIAGIKHTLSTTQAPRAEPAELFARCEDVAEESCGRRNPDAIKRCGGMGGSSVQWMCKGCGEDPRHE
jgi:hypothetical protein